MKPGLISPGTRASCYVIADTGIFCETYLSIPGGYADGLLSGGGLICRINQTLVVVGGWQWETPLRDAGGGWEAHTPLLYNLPMKSMDKSVA